MKFFQSKIVRALASALGTVIKMEDHTKNRTMCHYAKVLIEIDMTKVCEDYIMFESKGHVLFASLKYEQLPSFCNHCSFVGYSLDSCRSVKNWKDDDKPAKKQFGKQSRNKQKEGDWVKKEPTPQARKGDNGKNILSKNGFEALANLIVEENDIENQMEQNKEVDLLLEDMVVTQVNVEENLNAEKLENMIKPNFILWNLCKLLRNQKVLTCNRISPGEKGAKGKHRSPKNIVCVINKWAMLRAHD